MNTLSKPLLYPELVHPPGYENPKPSGVYDLVVLGGGTAGLVAAQIAKALGARVALIEKHRLGGDCLNFGCVPSKAILRASKVARILKQANTFGIASRNSWEVEFPEVMARMRRIREGIAHHDSVRRLKEAGIEVFFGEGRFLEPRRIAVGEVELEFRRSLIATGASPFLPPLPGMETVQVHTNETIFSLEELPECMAIIGGGPIGCELSQAFQRFGTSVHLFEIGERILPQVDPQTAQLLKEHLEQDGVTVHTRTTVTGISQANGKKLLLFKTPEGEGRLKVEEILVAIGRVPNTQNLGLKEAGIQYERRGVTVNEYLQTTNPRVYAAGDICSPYKFTHVSDAHARIAVENALFWNRRKATQLVIPWCIYTDPEVAHVGNTAEELEKEGIPYRTFELALCDLDRPRLDGEEQGFFRVYAAPRSGKILGATLMGEHAGELIGEFVLAMERGIPLSQFSRTIRPYPTYAEGIRKLGDLYMKSRFTPGVARLLHWVSWLFLSFS